MMSSEEEATAANVLSQMSQIQQIACETIEATVINVGHQCDVETTAPQEAKPEAQVELETAELVQQVQLAVQGAPVATDFDKAAAPAVTTAITTNTTAHSVAGRTGKVYPCEYCGKEFNKSYNLKTHIRVHTGERPYQCEVCAHGFANLGDLKRHSRTHTGEKPFRCEYCSKVFSDFGSHKRHLRLHTGFKPFRCEHCDRDFTRLDSYKNHVRLHTGDRPYKCDACGKEFNYLTTYKRHLNIHKGEKPYPCDQCEKKFTRLNYLKNHLYTHAKLSTQECQTEVSLPLPTNASGHQDEEIHVDRGTSEEVVAAESLKVDSSGEKIEDSEQVKGNNIKTNSKGTQSSEQNLTTQDVVPEPDSEKTPDSSLLQQVTQVLGEIVPHNVSAEVTEGASGPQIVVQGVDGTGGEFKITLAQQLLIAQHLLNQGQFQRVVQGNAATADGEQPQITTVTIPELSAELAQQIVSQAAMQHTPQTSTTSSVSDTVLVQSPMEMDVVGVQGGTAVQSHDQATGMVVESDVMDVNQEVVPSVQVSEEVVAQGSNTDAQGVLAGTMLEDSTINSIPVAVSSQDPTQLTDNAVYVAIDPSQTDVQQLLSQIQVVSTEMPNNTNHTVSEV